MEVEVTPIERGPHSHLPETDRERYREYQCVRRHQSKERLERQYRREFARLNLAAPQMNASFGILRFLSWMHQFERKKPFIPERFIHQILKELVDISGRVRKFIRARELAASHKLEQMRRVQMLEHESRTSAVPYPPCAPQIPQTRSASRVK